MRPLILPLALALAAPSVGPAREEDRAAECGLFCLAVALDGTGIADLDLDGLRERLGPPTAEGYSLARLDAAAAGAGAETLAVHTSVEGLGRRREAGERFACIAHVDGDHFVLLADVDPAGRVKVIDPPHRYTLPPETLATRWGGDALLISRDPLTPEENLPGPFPWAAALCAAGGVLCLGAVVVMWKKRAAAALLIVAAGSVTGGAGCDRSQPAPPVSVAPAVRPAAPRSAATPAAAGPRIEFDSTSRDAGEIAVRRGGHEFSFPYRNSGTSTLTIEHLASSCGCTAAVATRKELAPGASGEVRALVTPDEAEERLATITVFTNDPVQPRTVLQLVWRAVAPRRIDPPTLDFGTLRPGERAEKTARLVRLDVPGAEPGRITAVTRPDGAPFTVERTGDALRVLLTAPAEAGDGTGTVSVELDGAWVDGLRLPVRWRVRDVVDVRPGVVSFNPGPPGGERSTRVIVSAEGPLDVGGVAVDGWPGLTAVARRLTGDQVAIDLRVTLPDAEGRREATLSIPVTVERSDGRTEARTLSLPIAAYTFQSEAET